ncbi:MAG: AbrB/MazE/SpoVT family DNA-binding domain-containing protein [Chthonomonadales bacterium]
MTRVLQKHGNSKALVFDKTMLDLLGVGEDGKLEVEISNGRMNISASGQRVSNDEIDAVLAELRPEYSQMLKTLANK